MRGQRLMILASVVVGTIAQSAFGGVADGYLGAYFKMFPTRATQAGYHGFDTKLEDFSAEELDRWARLNHSERDRVGKLLNGHDLRFEDRLDAEALLAHVERELHEQ